MKNDFMNSKEVKEMEKLMRALVDAVKDAWAISDTLTLWLMSKPFPKDKAKALVRELLSKTNKACRDNHRALFAEIGKIKDPTETKIMDMLKRLAGEEGENKWLS
jgi:hypothetical protein